MLKRKVSSLWLSWIKLDLTLCYNQAHHRQFVYIYFDVYSVVFLQTFFKVLHFLLAYSVRGLTET